MTKEAIEGLVVVIWASLMLLFLLAAAIIPAVHNAWYSDRFCPPELFTDIYMNRMWSIGLSLLIWPVALPAAIAGGLVWGLVYGIPYVLILGVKKAIAIYEYERDRHVRHTR